VGGNRLGAGPRAKRGNESGMEDQTIERNKTEMVRTKSSGEEEGLRLCL
jgi:hypothetical protein